MYWLIKLTTGNQHIVQADNKIMAISNAQRHDNETDVMPESIVNISHDNIAGILHLKIMGIRIL